MTLKQVLLAAIAVWWACGAGAADLTLPTGARQTVERATNPDSYAAPIGVFSEGGVPSVIVEGSVTRTAWRIGSSGLTTLQVMAPLRAQLEDEGYTVVFECASTACGGFDFRFLIEVLPGPNMYVNIASYRYLTAFKGPREDPVEAVTVLTSVTAASAYLQIIDAIKTPEIGQIPDPATQSQAPDTPNVPLGEPPVAARGGLLESGFFILDDLDFATGTTNLGAGPFASLEQLAEVMTQRPDLRVALVGHTDTIGGLDVNITVSRARARSVRTRLIEQYDIDGSRLDAEGMGYLAPIASNLSAEGRSQNRRVEAILLGVE